MTWFNSRLARNPISFLIALFSLACKMINLYLFHLPFYKMAKKDIEEARGSLEFSSGIENRVSRYMLYHGFLAYILTGILERRPSKTELKRFMLLSACAPMLDDLTDYWHVSNQELLKFIDTKRFDSLPEIASTKAKKYLEELYQDLSRDEIHAFERYSKRLINAQSKGNTDEKAKSAAQLYGILLNSSESSNLSQHIEALGLIGQTTDDIFDYYSDINEGLTTEVNQLTPDQLEAHLDKMTDDFKSSILLSHPYLNTLFKWQLIIILSAGYVAIKRYVEINEEKTTQKKSIVIDMEKWSNRFQLLIIAYKKSKN